MRVHLGLFIAEVICLSAFVLEVRRALSGNTLSWAYVIEWPVLGAYGIYVWRKLLKDEASGDARCSATSPSNPPEDDAPLAAWNEYLAQVHSRDQSHQEEA